MLFRNIVLASFCCVSFLSSCSSQTQSTNLSVTEFEKIISNNNIQLLDVRTPDEYQAGHLRNAMLADWNNENEFKKRAQSLDKNKPIYTYCLSGARSNAATKWLRQNGFIAYNLLGGINAWKNANKPFEQDAIVKQITLSEYMSSIPKDKLVLVDISAVWCPPCKVMTPIVDSLALAHKAQFQLLKIDGGQQSDICKLLKIEAFPTFIIYKQGKEIWRKNGIVDAKELMAYLK